MEGQTATLECEVTAANPNTSITWQWFNASNHNTVLFSGAKYTIPYIQRKQSGLYYCTANNSIGASKPTTINMNIQCKYKFMCMLYFVLKNDFLRSYHT